MSDRIKLAEAMGWTACFIGSDGDCYGVVPVRAEVRPCKRLPDPFTDANDDYAVLEWMRENIDTENPLPFPVKVWKFAELINEMIAFDYQIGDYARAALKVLEQANE